MTDPIIEVVARALCVTDDEDPDKMLGDGSVEWYRWEQYDELAAAAITAFLKAVQEDEATIERVADGIIDAVHRSKAPRWWARAALAALAAAPSFEERDDG